jgi:hypothetical protein
VVGNLFTEDFRNIWNSDKYQTLRNTVAGRIDEADSFYCYDCIFNPAKIRTFVK